MCFFLIYGLHYENIFPKSYLRVSLPCNISVKQLEIKKSKETTNWRSAFSDGLDFPFLNLGYFLISVSLVLHTQTSWRSTITLQTGAESNLAPTSKHHTVRKWWQKTKQHGALLFTLCCQTFPDSRRNPFIQNSPLEISGI